jgi:hypothetical protein
MKLRAVGLAALESVKEFEVEAQATNVMFELDLAQQKLAPGLYALHLQVEAKGKYRRVSVEEEKAAREESKTAEKEAVELASAAKKAKEYLEAIKKDDSAAGDAKATAERMANEAATKAKEAEARKEAASKRAQDFAERAKLKDVTVRSYSLPISLKVTEPPKS